MPRQQDDRLLVTHWQANFMRLVQTLESIDYDSYLSRAGFEIETNPENKYDWW